MSSDIQTVYEYVRRNGQYVPRDHKTIGGMWTVDTWVLDIDGSTIKAQLMDEGYTQVIVFNGASAYSTNGNAVCYSGPDGEQALKDALALVQGVTQ